MEAKSTPTPTRLLRRPPELLTRVVCRHMPPGRKNSEALRFRWLCLVIFLFRYFSTNFCTMLFTVSAV